MLLPNAYLLAANGHLRESGSTGVRTAFSNKRRSGLRNIRESGRFLVSCELWSAQVFSQLRRNTGRSRITNRSVLRYTLVFEHFRARARHRRVYTLSRVRIFGRWKYTTKVPWNRLDSAAVTTVFLGSC